jgi:hypothetical protein
MSSVHANILLLFCFYYYLFLYFWIRYMEKMRGIIIVGTWTSTEYEGETVKERQCCALQ